MRSLKLDEIASICHEANRQLTRLLGDVPVQPPWIEESADVREAVVRGVAWHLDNAGAPASASHEEWVRDKLENGWKLGPAKDITRKEHPHLVPYEQLADATRLKDALFRGIVAALCPQ